MVVEAHAVARKTERGDGVEEAGSQATEAAIAKRRLDLELLNLVEVMAGSLELNLDIVIKAQVNKIVDEQLADQELGGNVIEFALALVDGQLGRRIARKSEQQLVDLVVVNFLERFAVGLLSELLQIGVCHESSYGDWVQSHWYRYRCRRYAGSSISPSFGTR